MSDARDERRKRRATQTKSDASDERRERLETRATSDAGDERRERRETRAKSDASDASGERRATSDERRERRATRTTSDTSDAETTLLIYKSPVSTTVGKKKTSVTIFARRWKWTSPREERCLGASGGVNAVVA